MEIYNLKFESNCDYDGALEFFNKKITAIKQIKKTVGEPMVYKECEIWVIKQEVEMTFSGKMKLIWLKLLNKFN